MAALAWLVFVRSEPSTPLLVLALVALGLQWSQLFGGIALLWICIILSSLLRRPQSVQLARFSRQLAVCCPVAPLVGHRAAIERWASGNVPFASGTSHVEAVLWKLPIFVFVASSLYGIWIFVHAPPTAMWRSRTRAHYCWLAIGCWFVTTVFYVVQLYGGAPVVRSVWGNRVIPLRYLLEPVAASQSITALYSCTNSVLCVDATFGKPSARWRRAFEFYRTLLFQCVMMMLAIAITLVGAPASVMALTAYALGYVCTWCVFYVNVATLHRWLSDAAEVPGFDPAASATFRWFAKYVVLNWHIHPLAWTLAACGLVSELAEHLMWFAADLLSKSIPMLVLAKFSALSLEGGAARSP